MTSLRRRLALWVDPSLKPPSTVRTETITDYTLDRLLAAEKDRIDRHMPDCYGPPGSCQSCGCNRRGRFDWPQGPCVSHAYIVAWAKHPLTGPDE